jgi:type I restriction enzyme, R subunit
VAIGSDANASPNFAFLAAHDARLAALGALAERFFADDPNTCLLKLRQLGELLAQRAAANVGLYSTYEESQAALLGRLRADGAITREIADLFHGLRKVGNAANHELGGDHREALHQLRMARELGVWFHRAFGDPKFKPGPFVPPPDPRKEAEALGAELARLRAEAAAHKAEAAAAHAALEAEAQKRAIAEERARNDAEERAEWEALATLTEAEKDKLRAELDALQAQQAALPPPARKASVASAARAADKLVLDEAATRRIIDQQLRDAGWEVDTEALTFARGARPEVGRAKAIAEWPTDTGPADYVLFLGLEAIGVVEAKRASKDVAGDIEQSKRYSRGLRDATPVPGGPWHKHRVPFLFATNGRAFLRQIATKSGIWFLDARRRENHPRALEGWPTPDGLRAQLGQDVDAAHQALRDEPTGYLDLRDYQLRAIRAVEEAIATGQRELLVAMATGTGKTRTCIGLAYRLLKTKRFRRVLFLVDRTALGEQAENAFKDARLESRQTFTDIFELKGIADAKPDKSTKVHVATIQAMVKRVLAEDAESPAVDAYDCVVVDECHRGYLLDRELGDDEMTFRDEAEYISMYRRVLDHFDAVKIGLTATPALHTTEIFGPPVFRYSYRDAVLDGFLVDHEPPRRIVTALAADGMTWSAGDEMVTLDPTTGEVDTVRLPDEVAVDIDSYNRRVITENFNRVVCERLARHIDPRLDDKTIVFCVNDAHADLVVKLLKDAFDAQYGAVDDDTVKKITGRADKPRQRIRELRNERLPTVAVTVDLLTTGVDIPRVSNLVFLRRVKSRILYDQMIGRATRLCPEIDKVTFRIFDAVDLYAELSKFTEMKPVVVSPQITFAQLVEELTTEDAPTVQALIVDQLLAKLQAKQRRMSPEARETFEQMAGSDPRALVARLREEGHEAAAAWLAGHPALAAFLDGKTGTPYKLILSDHADEVREETLGYGSAKRPEDYLDGFARFLRENLNKLPALTVVTQRPRDLTRASLRELKIALDQAGYSEAYLRTAWREASNADIAASIIGFVRRAALGDALLPYGERVDRALAKILASRPWTTPQRKWLERIGKQLKVEIVVDRQSLDEGAFKEQAGGFERLDKQFDGRLDELLGDLREAIWMEAG